MATQIWGVEYWGPALVSRWKTIEDNKKVSMRAFDFDKLPSAIKDLPTALSIISEPMVPTYSEGQLCNAFWKGRTQFYLSKDVSLTSYNYVQQFYRKITEAAAGTLTLNGKVELFTIGEISPALLKWGSELDYIGLVVPWEITEDVTGKFTVGV
jgi:hypothetical protein